MKTLIAAALLLTAGLVHADVLVVNIYNPLPGKGADVARAAGEAKAIHQKHGAAVTTAMDLEGRLHYVTGFDNWQAYAKFRAALGNDTDWADWQARVSADPSAVQEQNYLLNVTSPSPVGAVYQVRVFEPDVYIGTVLETAMKAKAIHEKAGATVAINVDQMGRLHYVTSFPSWDAWAKNMDTPNEAFQQFMAEQAADPKATLVKVYTASAF